MGRLFRRPTDGPRRTLWQRIKELALTDVTVAVRGGVDEGSLEKLEELLLEADFGVATTSRLVAGVEHEARDGVVRTRDELLGALRSGVEAALRTGDGDPTLKVSARPPTVILVIGVNGAGKTTFIGKLSARMRREGRRVLIAAGDTFRAGAVDQLRVWAERTGAQFIAGATGRDPAAVAVDAQTRYPNHPRPSLHRGRREGRGRCTRGGSGLRSRCGAHRYRGSPPYEWRLDGGAQESRAGHLQAVPRRPPRDFARPRCDDRPERDRSGPDLRGGGTRDGIGGHEGRWHREGRRPVR